jgi:hypothetical protein
MNWKVQLSNTEGDNDYVFVLEAFKDPNTVRFELNFNDYDIIEEDDEEVEDEEEPLLDIVLEADYGNTFRGTIEEFEIFSKDIKLIAKTIRYNQDYIKEIMRGMYRASEAGNDEEYTYLSQQLGKLFVNNEGYFRVPVMPALAEVLRNKLGEAGSQIAYSFGKRQNYLGGGRRDRRRTPRRRTPWRRTSRRSRRR